MTKTFAIVFGISSVLAMGAYAQDAMTTEELQSLTDGGKEIMLGGEGHGYSGTLMLNADGTGIGGATTDAGDKLTITGTWHIADGKFCRTWNEFDGGAEVCEVWKKTSENSVDVYKGDAKLGVNSW